MPVCTTNLNPFVCMQPTSRQGCSLQSCRMGTSFRQEDLLPTAPAFAASPPSLGQRAQPLCSSCRGLLLIIPPGPGEGLLAEPGSSNPASLHNIPPRHPASICLVLHQTPQHPTFSIQQHGKEGRGAPHCGVAFGVERDYYLL